MIDNELLKKIGEAHRGKKKEGVVIGEVEDGIANFIISGDMVTLIMVIERILNRVSELAGVSFNEIEQMVWDVHRTRKETEEER